MKSNIQMYMTSFIITHTHTRTHAYDTYTSAYIDRIAFSNKILCYVSDGWCGIWFYSTLNSTIFKAKITKITKTAWPQWHACNVCIINVRYKNRLHDKWHKSNLNCNVEKSVEHLEWAHIRVCNMHIYVYVCLGTFADTEIKIQLQHFTTSMIKINAFAVNKGNSITKTVWVWCFSTLKKEVQRKFQISDEKANFFSVQNKRKFKTESEISILWRLLSFVHLVFGVKSTKYIQVHIHLYTYLGVRFYNRFFIAMKCEEKKNRWTFYCVLFQCEIVSMKYAKWTVATTTTTFYKFNREREREGEQR